MRDPLEILPYHEECQDYWGLNLQVAIAVADRNNQELTVAWCDGLWDSTPRLAILRPNEIFVIVENDHVKRAYRII